MGTFVVNRDAESTDASASELESRFHPRRLLAILIVAIGVFVSPVPEGMSLAAHRLLAVAVLMAGLWMTQAIPLAVTSLVPLALFPLLGIQSARDVSKGFVEDNLFLYIGGMMLALGIERWQLHRRIALHVVAIVGVSPKRMVAGFAIATFALSMWISNTATTMLMLPIGLAMLQILDDNDSGSVPRRSGQLAIPLLLTLAYASTLGGMATPVGSPTNSQALGLYREQLPDAPEVTFAAWLLSCGPIAIVYLAVVWFVLTRGLPGRSVDDERLHAALRDRLRLLGPMTAAEVRMATTFGLTAILWITRGRFEVGGTTLFAGWASHFGRLVNWLSGTTDAAGSFEASRFISDATVSVLMAILLFVIPSGTRDRWNRVVPLMDWKTAGRLPWDMILLFGGGFALASGFEATGLARWLGAALQGPLEHQPAWLVVAVVCLILIMLSELTSNVATVSAVMPALLAMAEPLHLDPRMLFVPATLAASAGFMLPVGTPPNAIVFGSGRIPAGEMARRGFLLNLAGVPILTAGTWLLIRPLMGIE